MLTPNKQPKILTSKGSVNLEYKNPRRLLLCGSLQYGRIPYEALSILL